MGGGQAWSKEHNSHFEMTKLTLVGFSQWWVLDPLPAGKTIPEPRPDLIIGGMIIKPTVMCKFLGVLFDKELHWREQSERVMAKATKWTLCACQLARPSPGISPCQM